MCQFSSSYYYEGDLILPLLFEFEVNVIIPLVVWRRRC